MDSQRDVTFVLMHAHMKKRYKQWTPRGTILEEEKAQVQSLGKALSQHCMIWLNLYSVCHFSVSKPCFFYLLASQSLKLQVKETLVESPIHYKEKDCCMILRLKHCGFRNYNCSKRYAFDIYDCH